MAPPPAPQQNDDSRLRGISKIGCGESRCKTSRGGSVTPTYKLVQTGFSDSSLTFLIHGSRVKWEGNIGYSDNHVNFETSEAPESLTCTLADGKSRRDVLFFDEPEAPANNFLSIYTRAGAEKADFKTIWD